VSLTLSLSRFRVTSMALNWPYGVMMGGFNTVGAAKRWMFPESKDPELTAEEKQQQQEEEKSMCGFCSVVTAIHRLKPCEHIICRSCKHTVIKFSEGRDQDPECLQCGASVISFEHSGASRCELKDVAEQAEKVYAEGKIPLLCATNDVTAGSLSTFWSYATATTTLECKALLELSMNEGKPACWDRMKAAAAGAMKAGNTLVLLTRDACPDLQGYAKESGGEDAFTAIFTADVAKEYTSFPGLDLDIGDVRDEFKVCVVSEFLEEDILDSGFYEWGPIPMDKCHLLVVTD